MNTNIPMVKQEEKYHTKPPKPDKMSKRRFGKVMRRLGRKHGQESVITKDKNKPAKTARYRI